MTQCSDQWLTTVSSLSWTKLLIDLVLFLSTSSVYFFGLVSITKFFLECASVKGERPLPMPVPRENVVCLRLIRRGTGKHPRTHVLTGESSGDQISPEPDLAGTGSEMSPEPNLSRSVDKILSLPSRTGCFSGDRTSPEPDVAGTGPDVKSQFHPSLFPSGTGPETSPEPELAGTGRRRNRTGKCLVQIFEKKVRRRVSPEPDVTGTGCHRNRI
ncbi:hypothetical protein OSB04_025123 [Centaurea solstitialis]|uniref:Uncharacterized protein n=1 Tax=Centaurea solstitialis TaxID=347529 RepID=A0AA38T0W7_9ASTR|nr:hypothetical protein OSB04_025123 [Centaurea solstitialis]